MSEQLLLHVANEWPTRVICDLSTLPYEILPYLLALIYYVWSVESVIAHMICFILSGFICANARREAFCKLCLKIALIDSGRISREPRFIECKKHWKSAKKSISPTTTMITSVHVERRKRPPQYTTCFRLKLYCSFVTRISAVRTTPSYTERNRHRSLLWYRTIALAA